ncbi:tetratricopeptide repeat protein [Cyanobacterium stanieri LEGE 03274]|uniref:Tetratricopeptide repeat protein n=1 Tax=Cyanobacterium stanieri LEGE 03274 TaxID=1828756 RepID=A0ABR9V4T7_9CHRO|nr:tetratricopeptide repeat protein [Cyanobacterium stanieri]MBE9222556.1 tetratricopeptide repeat protein [Cyanobacterium stanieri LEGE 03274]
MTNINKVDLFQAKITGNFTQLENQLTQYLSNYSNLDFSNSHTKNNLHTLTKVYLYQRKYDEAKQLINSIIETKIQHSGEENYEVVYILENLAFISYLETYYPFFQDTTEAKNIFLKLLALQRELYGQHSFKIIQTLIVIGVISSQQEAPEYLKQALDLCDSNFNNNEIELAYYLWQIGSTLLDKCYFFGEQSSELEYVEVVLTECLEVCQKKLPESHPLCLSCMVNLAQTKHHLTHYQSAEKLLRKSLSEYEKRFYPFHPQVFNLRHHLIVNLQMQSKYEELAEFKKIQDSYREYHQRRVKGIVFNDPDIDTTLYPVDEILTGEDETEEFDFATEYPKMIEKQREYLSQDNFYVANSLENSAYEYLRKSELFLLTEVETLLLRSLQIKSKILGQNHEEILDILSTLAYVYELQQKQDYCNLCIQEITKLKSN